MRINKLSSTSRANNVPGRRKPLFIQELDIFNLKLCNQQKRAKIRREKYFSANTNNCLFMAKIYFS